MMPAVYERVRTIASDVFKLPEAEITPQSSPQTVATWDSVQHLNLILALEQEFDLQFEPGEMDEMNSVDRILSVLESKLNQNA
jgi:acyl carrier protein